MKKILSYSAMFALCAQPALAYIDPGSGSALMSVIIGALVAIGMFVKTFWFKIENILGISKNKKLEKNDDNFSDRN